MAHSVHPDAPTRTHAGGVAALLDRYEILGVIGQGGMGTVYKGYHLVLKRFVAIKILRIDQIGSPAVVARFLREMQAVGQMDHPNVVRATDGGERNGLFYLVMEFLEGKNLSQLTAGRDGLRPADACELIRQAALGLDYIHQRLVHRDVKPSNLLLTPAGVVKILDLGLARLHEADPGDKERTPEGCAVGTFDYMAPEQATGSGSVDGRTDIYSLGCTLFKLLTGRPPFSGPDYDSVARKLYAHGHVPLTALAAFQAVPEQVRPVLLRMTAKDPADRYAAAGEAARDLALLAVGSEPARLLAGSGGEATLKPLPAPPPEELSRLTGAPTETRPNISEAAAARPSARPLLWPRVLVGAGLLACVLAAAWLFVTGLVPWRGAAPPPTPPGPDPSPSSRGTAAEPRALDPLEIRSYHPLLDQAPLPIPSENGGRPMWRWDAGQQRVEIDGPDLLLLQLGTTSRPSFTFESGVEQAPWTGHVGLFWGYHEDAAAKAAREPNREFAWFQMLCVWEDFSDARGNQYFARRAQCGLKYNARGELSYRADFLERNEVPSPFGQVILQINVDHDRLLAAHFGAVDLKGLCSDAANDHFKSDPCRGGLGLITLSFGVRFGDARFLAR